jgi:DNA-binding SARP family transcriptional activator
LRDALAELLWPKQRVKAARGNFRRALANLRSVLGDRTAQPPHLLITRDTVQFNLASDVTVDVVRFRELVKTPASHPAWVNHLEQAVALYRGPFLEGFHLDDCPELELWMLQVRGDLERLAAGAFYDLARHYHSQGDLPRAEPLYRRSLALNPYDEGAQRGLMAALASSGQRGAALAHYAAYRRELRDELGAQPEALTVELAEALQQGWLPPVEQARFLGEVRTAALLSPMHGTPDHPSAGRDKELAALHACAWQAAQGRGGVAFVVGEAGSGKTALLHEFARQLERSRPPRLVALGRCTGLLGLGDLFQPVVDALRMLVAGEAGTPGAQPAGPNHLQETSPGAAEVNRLLWQQAPHWARLVLAGDASGPTAQAIGKAATTTTPQPLADAAPNNLDSQARLAPQVALFDQLTRFLDRLAQRRPLLLALDNLHWADTGAVALLFHLAQHLARSRVLIVASYRPGALALAKAELDPSLAVMVQTVRHQAGAVLVDLDQADGRAFVDALLDREPNRLGDTFRQALYRHTEGHALFTVELLHALAAAGHLSRDQAGRWVESGVPDWAALPPRVEALIRERIDRLAPADRSLLNAACVQGDEFRAEVVASALGADERAVVERLSGELAAAHRLVQPPGVEPGARYRFRHHLFRAYLMGALDPVQRYRLHRDVGLALERLAAQHGAASGVSLPELAWHFEQAGERAKALGYLRAASERALAWHAYAEAAAYLTRALTLASPEDLTLRFELVAARERASGLLGDHRAQSQDVGELERLAELLHDPPRRLVAALRRAALAQATAHYDAAIAAANAALALAVASHNPLAEVEGHRIAGRGHWYRGELELARRHYAYALRQARALPAPDATADCLLHLGVACWSMDDLAGAEAAFGEALDSAAAPQASFVRAAALMGLGIAARTRGDYARCEGRLGEALAIARELRHPWLEGQVLLNQLALGRLSARYDRAIAIHSQLEQLCQAIDDRWTAAAAQVEAAALFVQLGAWARARSIAEQVAAPVDAMHAMLLKVRLLHLEARVYLAIGESAYEGAAAEALPIAVKLGVPSIVAESWLLMGLVQQWQGQLQEAAGALQKARSAAQGEAARRLLPEIIAAQAQLALAQGDASLAMADVEQLLAGGPDPLVNQAADPPSLYLICYTVMEAAGELWAGQMLVRGCRLLREHAALIPDPGLRRSFLEDTPRHRDLLALCSTPEA